MNGCSLTLGLSGSWTRSYTTPMVNKRDKSDTLYDTRTEGDGRGLQESEEEQFGPS